MQLIVLRAANGFVDSAQCLKEAKARASRMVPPVTAFFWRTVPREHMEQTGSVYGWLLEDQEEIA